MVTAISIGLLMAPVTATWANPGRAGTGNTPQRAPGEDGTPEVGTGAVIRAHVPHNRPQSQLPAGADARGPPSMNAKKPSDDHTKLHGPPSTVLGDGTPLGSRAKGKERVHGRRSVRVCCHKTITGLLPGTETRVAWGVQLMFVGRCLKTFLGRCLRIGENATQPLTLAPSSPPPDGR